MNIIIITHLIIQEKETRKKPREGTCFTRDQKFKNPGYTFGGEQYVIQG